MKPKALNDNIRIQFPMSWRLERGLILGSLAIILASSAVVWCAYAGNYEADNYDGSFGDVGTGGDYGHTYDACGNECGNTSVYVGPGPIGGSTSSRTGSRSYGRDGGAYENRR